jgi:hypothetical protein
LATSECRVTVRPSSFTHRSIPSRIRVYIYIKPLYTRVPNSIILNSPKWKKLKCKSTHEWLAKMKTTSIIQYCSATKRMK